MYLLKPFHVLLDIFNRNQTEAYRNTFYHWLARKLPTRLVYWCSIVTVAHATTGEYGNTVVPELSAMDAIGRYGNDKVWPQKKIVLKSSLLEEPLEEFEESGEEHDAKS